MSSEQRSQGRGWWATLPRYFRVVLCAWAVSLVVFFVVTLAELRAVNAAAVGFGVLTGVSGGLLLADIGGLATIMAQRPKLASRWALESGRASGSLFYRVSGAGLAMIGVVMFLVGVLGKIHYGRY